MPVKIVLPYFTIFFTIVVHFYPNPMHRSFREVLVGLTFNFSLSVPTKRSRRIQRIRKGFSRLWSYFSSTENRLTSDIGVAKGVYWVHVQPQGKSKKIGSFLKDWNKLQVHPHESEKSNF